MSPRKQELLRTLPSMSALLERDEVEEWLDRTPRATVVSSIRETLESCRNQILAGAIRHAVDVEQLLEKARLRAEDATTPSLKRVINATGIVLHTGLGRAPLCEAAIDAIADGASSYCNLEFNLDDGQRGRRIEHVERHLVKLTGAEAATVVNNNAAATVLVLQTLAADRDVIVSRGELIEIGGSFRLPDIMRTSGARLCEVGTTNRTRISDYRNAISQETSMLLKAHSSNFQIVGFTENVSIDELVALARQHNLIAVDDIGSGVFVEPDELGDNKHLLEAEPSVHDSIRAGADLVLFSGDKLLGGPQCGIILGRRDLVRALESNPLARALRIDKLSLLALEATLRQYADPEHAVEMIPTLAMLQTAGEVLAERAQKLCSLLSEELPDEEFFVCSAEGFAGGGSVPMQPLESVVVQWRAGGGMQEMAARLRGASIPVVATIRNEAITFDVRTIRDDEFELIVQAVRNARTDP